MILSISAFLCLSFCHSTAAFSSSSSIAQALFERSGHYDKLFRQFSEAEKAEMKELSRETFNWGYSNYIKHAYPADELNPIWCRGRGPDLADRSNININDVLGNFSLTMVDALDAHYVMGNFTEFKRAVQLVIKNVSFDSDSIIQVFEATIRVIGGLLSAHLLLTDPRTSPPLLQLVENTTETTTTTTNWYHDELLYLARDLGLRLLPAFNSTSGIPYPRVHLQHGVPNTTVCPFCRTETNPAGAGSLLLEFGILSRLLQDSRFEEAAEKAVQSVWGRRSKIGLLGNAIDVESTEWLGEISGVGAGSDSFYEYLVKSYILFGEPAYLEMFEQSYDQIRKYLRRGREQCNSGTGPYPYYANGNMHDGRTMTNWIDSLSAAWPGILVLAGQSLDEAVCNHLIFFAIWVKFGLLPERFDLHRLEPVLSFYPLRPELAESTYLLYQATKNPFYLHVGRTMLQSINKYTRSSCGFATVHDVQDKSLEDRMESFFLSETCKYLYLLFDEDNILNRDSSRFLFSTQGHIFPLDQRLRQSATTSASSEIAKLKRASALSSSSFAQANFTRLQPSCRRVSEERRHFLPLKSQYFAQLSQAIGIEGYYSF